MYSDIVYLFAHQFAPQAGMLSFKEELPDGTKVDQARLADAAVLAALLYLYDQKLIDIYVAEGKILFVKTKTAKAKKLTQDAKDLTGLEAIVWKVMRDESDIYAIARSLLRFDVGNPWGDIIAMVKHHLTESCVLNRVEKGKVLMIKTYKHVLAKGLPKDAEKKLKDLQKSIKNLQSNEELFKKVSDAIKGGIASRQERPDNN